jgi:hypothetical protein
MSLKTKISASAAMLLVAACGKQDLPAYIEPQPVADIVDHSMTFQCTNTRGGTAQAVFNKEQRTLVFSDDTREMSYKFPEAVSSVTSDHMLSADNTTWTCRDGSGKVYDRQVVYKLG